MRAKLRETFPFETAFGAEATPTTFRDSDTVEFATSNSLKVLAIKFLIDF